MSHYPISSERQCKGTAFSRYTQLFAVGKVILLTFNSQLHSTLNTQLSTFPFGQYTQLFAAQKVIAFTFPLSPPTLVERRHSLAGYRFSFAFGPRIAMVDTATLNRRATETSALPHKSADLRGPRSQRQSQQPKPRFSFAFGPRIAMVDTATLNRRATETSALPTTAKPCRGPRGDRLSVIGRDGKECRLYGWSHGKLIFNFKF